MIYFVMQGLETVAICSNAKDAHALAGYNYETKSYGQVVAKSLDNKPN